MAIRVLLWKRLKISKWLKKGETKRTQKLQWIKRIMKLFPVSIPEKREWKRFSVIRKRLWSGDWLIHLIEIFWEGALSLEVSPESKGNSFQRKNFTNTWRWQEETNLWASCPEAFLYLMASESWTTINKTNLNRSQVREIALFSGWNVFGSKLAFLTWHFFFIWHAIFFKIKIQNKGSKRWLSIIVETPGPFFETYHIFLKWSLSVRYMLSCFILFFSSWLLLVISCLTVKNFVSNVTFSCFVC